MSCEEVTGEPAESFETTARALCRSSIRPTVFFQSPEGVRQLQPDASSIPAAPSTSGTAKCGFLMPRNAKPVDRGRAMARRTRCANGRGRRSAGGGVSDHRMLEALHRLPASLSPEVRKRRQIDERARLEPGFGNLREKKFLVVGATGHVGSKVAIRLAEKGYDVTAMVRLGRRCDPRPVQRHHEICGRRPQGSPLVSAEAVAGKDVVISSANGILPQKKGDNAGNVNESALELIRLCEEAGVSRFVQSSVPPYNGENKVPELRGKRLIEQRLKQSNMQNIVVRNAAFMDVFIPMRGFRQAQDASAPRHHQTQL